MYASVASQKSSAPSAMPKSGPSSARKADRVSEDKAVPSPVCMAMRRVMFIGTLPQIETSPHKSRSATMIVLCDGLEFDRDQDLRWSQMCQFRTTIRLESRAQVSFEFARNRQYVRFGSKADIEVS